MQINVSGHQMEITEPLRDYVNEKIGRIQKHFAHVTNTNVVLHV
ncbi:MAG: ribosome-associated translation inhibitor RaiA, partial [Pseudomonadota bacterium]